MIFLNAEGFLKSSVLQLRVCHGEPISAVMMIHLRAETAEGRRAGLRMAHQNFHPRNLGHIAFKVLIHYIQACATTPDKTCALRPPRECDRSREQMSLAPRATQHLAALWPPRTHRSVRAGI